MESRQTYSLNAFGASSTRSVPHILEKIFFSLDYKSFKTCMTVNKTWRKLLSTKPYLRRLEELLIEKQETEKMLYDASKDGNVEAVKGLIKHYMVDVNVVMKWSLWDHSTPLIEAVSGGHEEVVKILLDAGALADKANKLGFYLLHMAALKGHKEIVELLLRAGERVDKADHDGYTPLRMAVRQGHLDVVQILLNHGADVNQEGLGGMTPLTSALAIDAIDVAKLLLQHGADPNKADRCGMTALHYAVLSEDMTFIKLLKKAGAEQNRKNIWGMTPLEDAITSGKTEAVKDLLKASSLYGKNFIDVFLPSAKP